jgi:hypothetical protein
MVHLNSLYSEFIWELDSSIDKEEPFEVHLEQLVSFLEDRKFEVEFLSKDCQMEMICTYLSDEKSGEFVLSPNLAKRLANFAISITVKVAPYLI